MKRISLVTRFSLLLPVLVGCQSSGLQFEESAISTTNGSSESVEYSIAETSDSQLRVMDRNYVKATLDTIFGPSIVNITNTRVDQAVTEFGGPCDSYKTAAGCSVSGSTQFPIVATTIPAREALRIRACDQIVANDAALLYAINHIRPATSSLTTLSEPSDEELEKIYDLFYTGRALPDSVRSSLKDIVTTAETQKPAWNKSESWRFVFLSICLASDWQTP